MEKTIDPRNFFFLQKKIKLEKRKKKIRRSIIEIVGGVKRRPRMHDDSETIPYSYFYLDRCVNNGLNHRFERGR